MDNSSFKKYLCSAFAFFICAMPAYSLELDMSVDEEIRKNYNPSKIELDALPPLPEIKNTAPSATVTTPPAISPSESNPVTTTTSAPPKTVPSTDYSKSTGRVKKDLPKTSAADDFSAIKVKKGTKFLVKSRTAVSDYSRAGAGLTFVSLEPVTKRYITIPAGTVFKGVVTESHRPQPTGNGGLIVIKADKIIYKDSSYSIDAKITKANGKKIFFNNIKGKRQYWKGVAAQIDKGENFYQKSRRASKKLADNPVGVIISPIPTVAGVVVYAVNLVGSPLFSIYYKGGHISLPAGTIYQIKLLEDLFIY